MASPLIIDSELGKTKRPHVYILKHGKYFRTTIELEQYYCDALQDAFGIAPTELKGWIQSIANTWGKNDAKGIVDFVRYEVVKALTIALLEERKASSLLSIPALTPTVAKKRVRSAIPRSSMTITEVDAFMLSEMPDYYILEKSDASLKTKEEQEAKHDEMKDIIASMSKKTRAKAGNFIAAVGNSGGEMSIFLKIAIAYVVNNPDRIIMANLKAHFMDGKENGSMSYTEGTASPQTTNCISLFRKFKIVVQDGGVFKLNPESLLLTKAMLKLDIKVLATA